eukprot:scaffold210009_cov22-Tisochrysis_lutea.AAC.1
MLTPGAPAACAPCGLASPAPSPLGTQLPQPGCQTHPPAHPAVRSSARGRAPACAHMWVHVRVLDHAGMHVHVHNHVGVLVHVRARHALSAHLRSTAFGRHLSTVMWY